MRQLAIVLVLAAMVGCARTSHPEANALPPTTMPSVSDWKMKPLPRGETNFFVFGDWGDNTKEQKLVARAAAKYVQGTGVQFVAALSVGDNIYNKLPQGSKDIGFRVMFEDMYDAQRMNMPFYMTFGNHDFDFDGVKHQLDYVRENPQSRWKMPGHWYRLDLPENRPMVTVLMLDSNRNRLSRSDWARQMAWMEEEMSKPRRTPWLVCVAHHPYFSNGAHGDNGVLQREWGPLMRKYNVDLYLCGHDHDLQHLQVKDWWPTFVLAGAGGREQKPMSRESRGMFSRKLFGFVHMRFFPDRVDAKYINAVDGQIVHHFVRRLDGRVEVFETTPNDKSDGIKRYFKVFDEGDQKTPVLPSLDPAPGENKEDWEPPSS